MPIHSRQTSFLKPHSLEHGSFLCQGRRKCARPLDPRRPLHLVMRATQARGPWSMLTRSNRGRIEDALTRLKRKYGIRVDRFANVGNHLHLVVRFKRREDFRSFLREFSGRISQLITRARKGSGLNARFWDELAYTRVLEWGRDYQRAKAYVVRNVLEALSGRGRDPLERLVILMRDRAPPDSARFQATCGGPTPF